MGMKEIEGILVYYKDELRDQSEKYSILMAEDIYVEHVEWLISHIKELEEQFKFCGMRNIIGNARENAACKRAKQAEARVKELETEARQRHRLAARFAGRKISQPSADSDLMAANDIDELKGIEWDRIANDLTEAKSENAKLLARVKELDRENKTLINLLEEGTPDKTEYDPTGIIP